MKKESKILRVKKVIKKLDKIYPDAWCSLNYRNEYELLIATILSAQCTDERVNKHTPKLFSKYKNVDELSNANVLDVEKIVYSLGFYKNKAKNIINASKKIVEKYNGEIPNTMNELIELDGVARKTANIVLYHAFSKNEGIAVDTHCIRISYRLNFTTKRHNPQIAERELTEIIEKKYWGKYTNWMVLHGRKYCISKKPKCKICPLLNLCPRIGVK